MRAPEVPGNTKLATLHERIRELEIERSTHDQYNQSEEIYRRILAASQDCIKVADLSGNLMYMNENGLRINEIGDFTSYIGRPWASLWPPEAASVVDQAIATAAAGEIARFNGFCPTAKGTPKWLNVTVSPVLNAQRRPELLLVISRDISAQVAADAAAKTLMDLLNIRVGKAEGALGEIQAQLSLETAARLVAEDAVRQSQKLEILGQLAAGIAHDFNNVLTAIVGALQLVEGQVAAESPLLRPVRLASRAADRATALVERLMAFARRDGNDLVRLDLCIAVRDLHQLMRHTLGDRHRLDIETASVSCPVLVDRGQFEVALLNLALNARDAMPVSGAIVMRVEEVLLGASEIEEQPTHSPGSYVLVSVTDSGVGMAPETKNRIFEPFFTTKELGKGTGLGLAQVYGFVSAAHGFIRVESTLGAGTTFRLYLPCCAERD
jgi:PAS domain S-box-containing protein